MDDLQTLEDWAAPLLAKLRPAEQRKLARTIARELRRSQAARIAAQRNPDGSAYAPRKAQPEVRNARQEHMGKGAIRAGKSQATRMFEKMRTTRNLKAQVNDQGAAVSIQGRAARIALVHQYGLVDQVQPDGPSVRYPARVLMGFSDAERERVREIVMAAIHP